MRSQKRIGIVAFVFLAGLVLSDFVLSQGTGRVYNPRLRRTYLAVNDALAESRNGDTLLIVGTVEGAVDLSLAPGGVTLLGKMNGGIPAVLSVDACPNTLAVIDASGRRGPVRIIGLHIRIPSGCYGILSGGNGRPLTVRNCVFSGISPTGLFSGIALVDEFGGPFLIEGNRITNQFVSAAILVDGTGSARIQATIRRNRIGSDVTAGIITDDIPSGSTVVIERNILDGGDLGRGAAGIYLNPGSIGVTIQRNTISNFGTGIFVDGAPESKILANHLQDNLHGIVVDTSTRSGPTLVINDNNILCTDLGACRVTGAVGLIFGSSGGYTPDYTLDARNNYWGASTGPDSAENLSPANVTCPEATGSRCTGPAGGGTGLPINADGVPDCSSSGPGVRTCPIRTAPNRSAGA